MTSWCYHDITVSNPRAEKTTAFWQRSLQVFTGIFIEMETRTFVIICKGKNLVQWVQMLGFYNLIYSSFHRIVCFNQPCPIGTKSLASHEKQNRIQGVFSFVNNSSFHLFNLCTVHDLTIFFIFVLWLTWQYWSSCYAIFIFKFYRMNRVTIWNIKWRNFSCKVIQFSSQKVFYTYNFLHFFSPHTMIWDPMKTERTMARESGKDRLGQVLSRNSRGYWALPLMTPRWIYTN